MSCPWIQEVLAGVFVLHGFGARTDAVLRTALARYRGGDLGGVDFMPPNTAGEAWLLAGVWRDCFDPQHQRSIAALHEALVAAADQDNAGVTIDAAGNAVVETSRAVPGAPRGEIRALHAYTGGLAIPWWEQSAERWESLCPALPRFVGTHMGAPHWLGRGVEGDASGLRAVTPYVRLDFVPDRGVGIAGMAEPRDFEPWLAALRAATGWP